MANSFFSRMAPGTAIITRKPPTETIPSVPYTQVHTTLAAPVLERAAPPARRGGSWSNETVDGESVEARAQSRRECHAGVCHRRGRTGGGIHRNVPVRLHISPVQQS